MWICKFSSSCSFLTFCGFVKSKDYTQNSCSLPTILTTAWSCSPCSSFSSARSFALAVSCNATGTVRQRAGGGGAAACRQPSQAVPWCCEVPSRELPAPSSRSRRPAHVSGHDRDSGRTFTALLYFSSASESCCFNSATFKPIRVDRGDSVWLIYALFHQPTCSASAALASAPAASAA